MIEDKKMCVCVYNVFGIGYLSEFWYISWEGWLMKLVVLWIIFRNACFLNLQVWECCIYKGDFAEFSVESLLIRFLSVQLAALK